MNICVTTFLTLTLYVSSASNQVGLEDETVNVSNALLLKCQMAGTGHSGTCGPVSGEAAPASDPDDKADWEAQLLCRHMLTIQARPAKAKDVISNHIAKQAVGVTERGHNAVEPRVYVGES